MTRNAVSKWMHAFLYLETVDELQTNGRGYFGVFVRPSSGLRCTCPSWLGNSQFTLRPELADTRREEAFDIFDLTRRDTALNDTKHRRRNSLGIHGGSRLFEGGSDLREK